MNYAVKEIFYSLQGEGAQTGRPAVFCRFAGCNLWSGRESDRKTAVCQFCDTDFVGVNGLNGGKFRSPEALTASIAAAWPSDLRADQPGFVICTGGEPLLQLDSALIGALHDQHFEVAVETNGTLAAPHGIDWLCVSPKARAELVQQTGHEVKLVFPQKELPPEQLVDLSFEHFFLQPMHGPNLVSNTDAAIQYCLEHPRWRLSLQTHKALGIP